MKLSKRERNIENIPKEEIMEMKKTRIDMV